MGKHLVLVGGGHAHMTAMAKCGDFIYKGHRVTLISPSPYQYYSGMGPGALSQTYRPQDIRFHVAKMVQDRGAVFTRGQVVRIDAPGRVLELAGGERITYDVVSFNIGSGIALHEEAAAKNHVIPVKPIINLLKGQKKIIREAGHHSLKLLVLGGGPAGVEIAGNLWALMQNLGKTAEITLVAGAQLLRKMPPKIRTLALSILLPRGIRILEGVHAQIAAENRAVLTDGSHLEFDFAFVSTGVVPPPLFRDSGFSTAADGGLPVNPFLQSQAFPEIFGGGDCIHFQDRPLDKVGVFAVRQNPILHQNLLNALEGLPLQRFVPQKDYLLILNLGAGVGIFGRQNLIFGGRPAFFFKNWIDGAFMRKFQLSGERNEPENLI
ncbi:MAG: FAD-dependent oxidoreductase [Deltaproteobacteria bacterium]|nr:FAD-dependent oxidoreductase [Deltaproteobacteria bacterium]